MEKAENKSKVVLKKCMNCNHEGMEFWDETNQEIIYRCKYCKLYHSIPFDKEELKFYFAF